MSDPQPDELVDAQFAGAKSALRPVYDELRAIAVSFGDDVEIVVEHAGVSFRRRRRFVLIQCPSAKQLRLSLVLVVTPDDPRIAETSGPYSHEVGLGDPAEIDDIVAGWIAAAYELAG